MPTDEALQCVSVILITHDQVPMVFALSVKIFKDIDIWEIQYFFTASIPLNLKARFLYLNFLNS